MLIELYVSFYLRPLLFPDCTEEKLNSWRTSPGVDEAKALNDRVGAAWGGADSFGVSKMLGIFLSCSRSQSMGASDERNSMRFIAGRGATVG